MNVNFPLVAMLIGAMAFAITGGGCDERNTANPPDHLRHVDPIDARPPLETRSVLPDSPDLIRALAVGQKVPPAIVQDLEGKPVDLTGALNGRSTVLVFYLGQWCPYCHEQLGDLNRQISEATMLGYQVIAISPDSPPHALDLTEQHDLKFTVLCDVNLAALKAFGLGYTVDDDMIMKFAAQGAKLPLEQSTHQRVLPVAAVYLVDHKGVVRFARFERDYRSRMPADEIIAKVRAR